MKKLYHGIYNYQGEIHDMYLRASTPTQAHSLFCRALSKKYQLYLGRFTSYFNGMKANYEVNEVAAGNKERR